MNQIFWGFFPAAGALDPNDPGDSLMIEYWIDIRDSIRDGTAPKYNWDQLPADASASSTPTASDATAPSPTGAGDDTAPQVPVHMDESAVKEYVHAVMEGEHYVGDTADVLGSVGLAAGAGEESLFIGVMEGLGAVGMIAGTIVVLWAVVEAFGTGRRLQEQEGFCYGVMWQAFSMANGEKQFYEWAGDSAEELHDSFYEGVAAGREKAADTVVHNKVMLATAYYQAKGSDLSWAQYYVLNDLWHHIRETDLGRDQLSWPKPADMGT